MKQVSLSGPTNIRGQRTKFSGHGDRAHGFVHFCSVQYRHILPAECVCVLYMILKTEVITSGVKESIQKSLPVV
jgi:hypothetical protein